MALIFETKKDSTINITDDRLVLKLNNGTMTSTEWELYASESDKLRVTFKRGIWFASDVACTVEIANETHFRRMVFHSTESKKYVIDAEKRSIKSVGTIKDKVKLKFDAENNPVDIEVPPVTDDTCRSLRSTVISMLRYKLNALMKEPSTRKETVRGIRLFLEAYHRMDVPRTHHYEYAMANQF